MKKIVSYMMTGILLLSFLLTGCGSPEPQTGKKMSMYYINTAETKVEVHEQYLNTKTLDEQLDETMRYLSTTPEKLEYKAPLDMGFRVLDYEVEDGKSQRYAVLLECCIRGTGCFLQGVFPCLCRVVPW